jgi:hypothetical protein
VYIECGRVDGWIINGSGCMAGGCVNSDFLKYGYGVFGGSQSGLNSRMGALVSRLRMLFLMDGKLSGKRQIIIDYGKRDS